MTKDEAKQHFGTYTKLAKALGVAQASVSLWGKYPPPLRQLQIEALTGGALKAEPGIALPMTANVSPQHREINTSDGIVPSETGSAQGIKQ